MLVFNEGVPRSGKSYDVVKNHVIPALKQGRKVYARLNGLGESGKRAKLAEYLGFTVERLDELLIHVTSAEVKTLFVASKDEAGEWVISDALKDAFFVVDECQQFYVAGREGIAPAIEEFYALCGQNGMDGVLMSQWYRRLHSSIRARIERKNSFQKLTAVGLVGKYTITRYHTTSADRFIKVDSETLSYDPAIFPLYKGYADGAGNTKVYAGGGGSVWRKIATYAVVMVPLALGAFYVFHHFFSGDGGVVARPSRSVPALARPVTLSASRAMGEGQGASAVVASKPHHPKMTPSQAYVFDLADKGRPRLAGLITGGADAMGVIEWEQDQGVVAERLDLAQIRDMGVHVEVHSYGVRLSVGADSMIVTAWPLVVQPVVAAASSPDRGQVVSAGQAASSGVAPGTTWHEREIGAAYVPPELVERPGPSTFSMH